MWLLNKLHEHHHTEDAGLWPLIRRRNPAAAGLLEAMETEHRAIVPAIDALTGNLRAGWPSGARSGEREDGSLRARPAAAP